MSFARLVLTALLGPPFLVGASLCALAAFAGQLGRWSPTFDLFTHFAPLYLAAGVLAVLMAVAFVGHLRAPVLVAGAACVLAAGLLMAPEYLRPTGPKAPAGAQPTFKVVQFNAWEGAGGQGRLLAWLGAVRPDVVVIEEANRRVLAAMTGAGWHAVFGRSGVMLFSRAAPLRVIVPADNPSGPMELNGLVVPSPLGPVAVLGIHAPWPTQAALAREHADLLPIVRSYPPATTILAGDFNSTPWSFARRRDDRDFGLIRRTRALFTWPVAGRHRPHIPLLPIDHVYAGSAWATVSAERGPRVGSDHYPVLVTLAPRERP